MRKPIGSVLFLLSTGLLVATLVGCWQPNDQRPSLPTALSYQSALEGIDAAFITHGPSFDFVTAATSMYAQAIDYSWPTHLAQVPVTDNWILHTLGYVDWVFIKLGLTTVPNLFSEFQSLDYRRGLRRGYGICSQNAIALVDMLDKRYQIDARVVGLDGHVVIEAMIEGNTIHDPSVGLSFPFSAENAMNHMPQLTEAYATTDHIEYAAFYDATGNVYEPFGAQGYQPKIYWIERLSDHLKWWLPILGICLGALMLRTKSVIRQG